MSKYDILFFDIDGTLVRDDHFTLSPRTRDALLAAREAGVKLAVASGPLPAYSAGGSDGAGHGLRCYLQWRGGI